MSHTFQVFNASTCSCSILTVLALHTKQMNYQGAQGGPPNIEIPALKLSPLPHPLGLLHFNMKHFGYSICIGDISTTTGELLLFILIG